MSGGEETVAKVVAMLHRDWEQEVGACVLLLTQQCHLMFSVVKSLEIFSQGGKQW